MVGRPRSGQAVVRGPVAVSYLLRAWSAQAPAHPRGALPSSLSMPGARSLTTTPAPGLWPCCVASCPGRCCAEVWREAWCGDELRRGSRSAQPTARPSRPFPHGCARLLSLTYAGAFPARPGVHPSSSFFSEGQPWPVKAAAGSVRLALRGPRPTISASGTSGPLPQAGPGTACPGQWC